MLDTAGHGVRAIELRHGGLFRRSLGVRQSRNLVSAPGSCGDLTVGDQRFALVQAGLLARPVNSLPPAVGKVHQLRPLDFDEARSLEMETGIVFGNHGIVRGSIPQLGRRTDSAWNYGIRIDEPRIAGEDLRPGQTGKNGQTGTGGWLIQNEGAMYSTASPLDARRTNCEQGQERQTPNHRPNNFLSTYTPPTSTPNPRMLHNALLETPRPQ